MKTKTKKSTVKLKQSLAEKLIKKYKLARDTYVVHNSSSEQYNKLFAKWKYKIEARWYGLELRACPNVWYNVVDELLEYLSKKSPEFKILQIKLKFGGIRIYLSGVSNAIQDELDKLEDVMFDEKLIY